MNIPFLVFALTTNRELKPFFAIAVVSLGLAFLGSQTTVAQNKDEPLVIKLHDVQDLFSRGDNQPFGGFVLPGIKPTALSHGSRATSGGYSASGGQSGGVFNIAPTAAQFGGTGRGVQRTLPPNSNGQPSIKIEELSTVIMNSIASETWMEIGDGEGSMQIFGNILIVSQTESVHSQIKVFLSMLREATEKRRQMINIKAIWLTIDETQLEKLDPQSNQVVDKKVLKKLAGEHGRRAQITCLNAQTVHVAAGNLKSSVESVVPIVGQHDLKLEAPTQIAKAQPEKAKLPKHIMAQVFNSAQDSFEGGNSRVTTERGIGHQPVSRWINYGSLLQLTPWMKSKSEIEIDLSSIIINPGLKIPDFTAGLSTVNRHNMHIQQFRSSCRVNVGTPTLVGGSTFESQKESGLQTYLIIEATPVVTKQAK